MEAVMRIKFLSVLVMVLEASSIGRRRLSRRWCSLIFLRMMISLLLPLLCLARRVTRPLSRTFLLLLAMRRILRDTRPLCQGPSTLVLPKVLALTHMMSRMSSLMQTWNKVTMELLQLDPSRRKTRIVAYGLRRL